MNKLSPLKWNGWLRVTALFSPQAKLKFESAVCSFRIWEYFLLVNVEEFYVKNTCWRKPAWLHL